MQKNTVTPALWAALVLLGLVTGGCQPSLVPFTKELRSQHDLSAKEVKRLQFYVSHSVTLRREATAPGAAAQ